MLAFTPLVCRPIGHIHLNAILLVALGVQVQRNIWPLMTFTLTPADSYEGNVLWAKIILLFLSAVAVPLVIPRRYIPVDPQASL